MAFYLIDYENVNTEGMQGIEFLKDTDEVIIFYSEYADRLTFDLHQKINLAKTKVCYIKVAACKKNALDFQLVTYLGYLVAQHQGARFYIVSRDNGFQSVVKFWTEKQILITQLSTISQAQVEPQENSLLCQVEKLFADTETAAIVMKCLRESHSKQELHNKMAEVFRSNRVGEYYQKVKHLL